MDFISLTKNKIAIIDSNMLQIINKNKWFAQHDSSIRNFYAARTMTIAPKKVVRILMHHMVVGKPLHGFVVDHINGDTLDNRRENLRIVTNRENSQNRSTHRNGRLVGATYVRKNNRWQSQIQIRGRRKYLGYFKTEEQAHCAYLNALNMEGLAS